MPPEGKPAPAMLMSFTMRSTAARLFCWFSARCVTSMVEFIPVLNRLAIAAITIRPTAIRNHQLQQSEAFFVGLFLRILMFPILSVSIFMFRLFFRTFLFVSYP